MKSNTFLLLLILLLVGGCKQKGEPVPEGILSSASGPIKITGAYALLPLMERWVSEYTKKHPEVTIEIQSTGSVTGVSRLLHGEADLAMISSELAKEADTQVWIAPVAGLGTVFIVNRNNPYYQKINTNGLNKDILLRFFTTGHTSYWGDLYGNPGKDPVHIYHRLDSAGATHIISRYLWLSPGDIDGIGVTGDPGMVEAVKKDPLALGYCNFVYCFNPGAKVFDPGLSVVPLDQNFNGTIDFKENFYDSVVHLQRAMWTGRYPCSLVRNLCIASKGKPHTIEVVDFLKYVLTEGQTLVQDAGYIELHSSENKCRLFFLDSQEK